jgi:hypothetical protein
MQASPPGSALARHAYDDLLALLRTRDRAVRVLLATALVLGASGVLHALVWAVDGGPWLGPVTWRKPIVFGLSSALLSLSLAWAVAQLPSAPRRLGLARLYAATMIPEVALITLQKWRGVASHFNVEAPLNAAIYSAMGALIVTASVPIFVWTVQAYRSRTLDPAVRATLLSGLGFVLVAVLFGFALSGHGDVVLRSGTGADPAVVGRAGSLKLPHGIAVHGIQVLPVLGWLLRRASLPAAVRIRWIHRATFGYGLLVASAAVLALGGRSVTEPGALPVVLAAAGALVLVAAGARALLAARVPVPVLAPSISE